MAQPFQVGDRVQTTRSHAGLACGSRGTIRQVFPAGEFYDVRFDTKLLRSRPITVSLRLRSGARLRAQSQRYLKPFRSSCTDSHRAVLHYGERC